MGKKALALVAEYALTGNAAAAADKVGVSHTTAYRLVRSAIDGDDPNLAECLQESGHSLRMRAIDTAERAIRRAIEIAADRLENTSHWIRTNSLQTDPGPQYAKAIIDAHKSLWAAVRINEERLGNIGPQQQATIVINTHPTEELEVLESTPANQIGDSGDDG